MIAVGIDISKSKSTVAILNSDGSLRIKPYDMKHNHPEMNALIFQSNKTTYTSTIKANNITMLKHQ